MSGERMTDAAMADLAKQLDGIADDLKQPYCAEIRKIAAALRARPQAVADVSASLAAMSSAMKADPDFAWTWHCNVAMTAQDAGAPHDRANIWAANFMQRAFDVDTLTQTNSLLAASQSATGGAT